LEAQPEARIVAPLCEDDAGGGTWLRVPAHPAAHALALALSRLNRLSPVQQCVVNVFEPASERGQKGINELHKQTTGLLSFKPLEKQVFDAQVAFNLLSRFGEDAPTKLGAIEQRIEHHLATLLSRHSGSSLLMPSLRLVQAPIFHGYSMSMWAEFQRTVSAEEVGHALASAHIEVRRETEEVPDIVGAAGQSGLIAGDIRTDRNNGRAVWVWIVADNLRMTADASLAIIRQGRPSLP
jgi:aspartate-semialdehyde dehydrogenase